MVRQPIQAMAGLATRLAGEAARGDLRPTITGSTPSRCAPVGPGAGYLDFAESPVLVTPARPSGNSAAPAETMARD